MFLAGTRQRSEPNSAQIYNNNTHHYHQEIRRPLKPTTTTEHRPTTTTTRRCCRLEPGTDTDENRIGANKLAGNGANKLAGNGTSKLAGTVLTRKKEQRQKQTDP
jgi:hypothetical protein